MYSIVSRVSQTENQTTVVLCEITNRIYFVSSTKYILSLILFTFHRNINFNVFDALHVLFAKETLLVVHEMPSDAGFTGGMATRHKLNSNMFGIAYRTDGFSI